MKYKILIACLCCSLFFSKATVAQESSGIKETFHPNQKLALVLGHAEVFKGRDAEGKKKMLSLPSWGIDYTYQFSRKWAVGLHTDIIIEKFEVQKSLESGAGEETIERSYPIAPALMGIYKPTEHWSFLLGMGGEFAKEENFVLTRAGVEYGVEIRRGWEVSGNLGYDFKWNAYDTWTIGIGILKKLGKQKPGKIE